MDYQTGQMRRQLQAAYGDAGHGFVALGRPWSHYQHMDVRHGIGGGFVSYAASTDPIWDRVYGLSGISAESRYGGARTWVGTAGAASPIGQSASRFEIFYAKGPSWGRFMVRVDGAPRVEVDSHAPALSLGVERLEVEDGPHEVTCVSTDERRPVRLLGATLERATPGFVVDSFGVGALNARAHAAEEPSINRAMLRERRYDLVIFATGANDVFTLDEAPRHMARLIELHREALPTTPILLLTPADRGEHDTFGPTLRAVEQRVAIARDNGCALWDQFAAMGGRGSMRRFGGRGLVHSDYIHFTQAGGAYIGDRLLHALMLGASQHLQAHPDAGCGARDRELDAVAQYSSQKK
jgi:lysophospholipase L1-like esterase